MRDSEGLPKRERKRKMPPPVVALKAVTVIDVETTVIVLDTDSICQTAAPSPTYRRRRTSGKKQKRHTEPPLDTKTRRVAPTSEYLQRITSLLLAAATAEPETPAHTVKATNVPPAWFDDEACERLASFAAISCDTLFKAPLFATNRSTSTAARSTRCYK